MELGIGDISFEILLVEDNPADVDLIQEALEETKTTYNLHVVKDGVEAMEFLYQEGSYTEAPRPDLVLLDLNLPRKDGRQVLAEVKADENLKTIPVVVLTTSKAEEDIFKSYSLHVNAYITKPTNLEQFITMVGRIKEFWLEVVVLPPK